MTCALQPGLALDFVRIVCDAIEPGTRESLRDSLRDTNGSKRLFYQALDQAITLAWLRQSLRVFASSRSWGISAHPQRAYGYEFVRQFARPTNERNTHRYDKQPFYLRQQPEAASDS